MFSNKHCGASEHRLAHELPPQQQSDFFSGRLSAAWRVRRRLLKMWFWRTMPWSATWSHPDWFYSLKKKEEEKKETSLSWHHRTGWRPVVHARIPRTAFPKLTPNISSSLVARKRVGHFPFFCSFLSRWNILSAWQLPNSGERLWCAVNRVGRCGVSIRCTTTIATPARNRYLSKIKKD